MTTCTLSLLGLAPMCGDDWYPADELEQLRGAYPGRRLELEVVGDTRTRGLWDGLRLQQMLRNVVSNAIKYGAPGGPVRVVLTGEEADVRIEVVNSGPAIQQSALDEIFDPLKRGLRNTTIPRLASGWDCISCAKLPGRMVARSMCVPTMQKPYSMCAYLAAIRLAFPDQHLLALPPNQQEVIRMAFLEEKSQREISDLTRTPLGTVKTRIELGGLRERLV